MRNLLNIIFGNLYDRFFTAKVDLSALVRRSAYMTPSKVESDLLHNLANVMEENFIDRIQILNIIVGNDRLYWEGRLLGTIERNVEENTYETEITCGDCWSYRKVIDGRGFCDRLRRAQEEDVVHTCKLFSKRDTFDKVYTEINYLDGLGDFNGYDNLK